VAKSASDHLGVPKSEFDSTGAFDPILDVDSRLFIDPLLLRAASEPEFQNVRDTIELRFRQLYRLLERSRSEGDLFWAAADDRFRFPEVRGLCIGYTSSGTGGSGMGRGLRTRALRTAREIIDAGIDDPIFFELLGLLQPGIGPDRISDMFASIAHGQIDAYSRRVFTDLGLDYASQSVNPSNGHPILLVPRTILRDLPLASSWDEVETLISHNAKLRAEVNALVGEGWRKERKRTRRRALREVLRSSPPAMRRLLRAYREADVPPYDFANDPRGRVLWYQATRYAASTNPMALSLGAAATLDDVFAVVLAICRRFKELIETNKLSSLLYESGGRPKHEEAAQLLLFGIADAYCEANDLDLSRESNAGRGAVDFKLSRGHQAKVLVETKLNTNADLVHGFETQLVEYQMAERAQLTVYVVIDVGGPRNRIPDLLAIAHQAQSEGRRVPTVIAVDGKPKAPASKYRRRTETD